MQWLCNVPVGQSGFATGIITVPTSTNPVTIASPADGTPFTGSKAIIKGAVDTTTPVNSVLIKVTTSTNTEGTSYLAQVNGKYFAAEIQLAPGVPNTVKAKVTYQNGAQNEASITVTGGTQQEMVKLTASPNVGMPTLKANGLTTLDVRFVAAAMLSTPVVSYAWNFNGDGTVDLTCSTLYRNRQLPAAGAISSDRNRHRHGWEHLHG